MEGQEVVALPLEGGETTQGAKHPMAVLLEQETIQIAPRRGDTVEGTIISVSPTEVVVDVGCKCEGIVGARDLERLEPEFRASLKVGDEVLVYVVRPEDSDGNIVLSLARAQVEGDWQQAAKLFEAEEVLEEVVDGYNRGGLIVNLGRLRGFVPASQIVSVRVSRDDEEEERESSFEQLVGTKLHLKIIELDRRRNRLILSERSAVREWRQERKDHLLNELQEGDIRRGVVSSLCDFGAFVDLGGADGLVHLSELSWRRVGHPKQILSVGQQVEVFVLGVDADRRRIALSMKRLQKEPWSDVEAKYQVGQLIDGTVTKLTNFGAFARLDEYIEGLIHISELSEDHIAHPKDVVQEGQELTLRIIRIDAGRQRIGLSLRRVNDDQYSDDYDWQSDQLVGMDGSSED